MRRAFVRVVRFFIDRPARLIGAAVALVALIAAAILLPTMAPGLVPRLALTPPSEPKATHDFMRGNQQYDAALVWESLADEARGTMAGGSSSAPTALQAQMQAAKQRGYRLEDIAYVGGRDLPDGTSMQFYLVGYRASSQADVEYVPYLFTLDTSGKILKVQ